jgi:transcriptional regulator with XRE-family HTH domain
MSDPMSDPIEALADLGRYIRAQRELAQLSLRHLGRMINVSDSYLSQVERGQHQPSGDVLKAIATGLGMSPDVLFRRAGWLPDAGLRSAGVVEVIGADVRLTPSQRSALVQMYKTMVGDI